jgi:site-specific DNA recombinase
MCSCPLPNSNGKSPPERIRDKIAASKRKGTWVGGPLPLGYAMKDGKIAVVEDEAERVRLIYRRYLELGGVNALVRDLGEKDVRTKIRLRATGATHGGIPFERGSLFYLLRNRFYIGEVKYKGEILPGEQPAIMDSQLFDAVQQKLTDQWSHRNHAKTKSDHLLTGLLYDDAGHRMIPTHASKAGIRYRYYVSLPHLKGEFKTVSVGSVSRIPATDIEDIIVKSVNERLVAQHDQPSSSSAHADDRGVIAEQVVRIDVHKDRLIVRFKSAGAEEESHSTDGELLSIPWQKPPSRKSRQILIPLGVRRNEIRPTRIERRARLVGAISRGRRWLDEIVSGSATNIEQIAVRQKFSMRQVNMTISLAFLAPDLIKAAVEGRLPRGIGVERLRDAPAEWCRQFETLGLKPQ